MGGRNPYGFKVFLLLMLTFSLASCTLSQSDKKKGSKKKTKIELAVANVEERGLVQERFKSKDIIQNHASYCDTEREVKRFSGETLAYVTPWNNRGYDIAKIFAHKFTYISPVWLQIKRKVGGGYIIEGTHDVDKGWIADLHAGHIQVVPRILFDGWSASDFEAMLTSEPAQQECIKTLLKPIRMYKFDGIVIEVLSQMGGQLRFSDLMHFLGHLRDELTALNKKLILVLPPPIHRDNEVSVFTREKFVDIMDVVDSVSLMTYDYSNPSKPGSNSPYEWVKRCVEYLAPERDETRRRILVGLNFYGNDYFTGGANAVLGPQFIDIITNHKVQFEWDERDREHRFTYKSGIGDHVVYYPTLKSIHERLKIIEDLGAGISIWEIGQGLDYFYDLL